MRWTTPRVVALAGMSLLAGTVLVGVAAAQTPTPTGTPTSTPTTAPKERAEQLLERFAQNLGVDPARVREALKQTALQVVDDALAAGRITEEQAQQARDRINSGELGALLKGFGGPGGHHRGPKFGFSFGIEKGALADFLGITPEQLRTELDGQSLAAVAAAHGKSADELKAHLTSTVDRKLDEAVAAGRIDQARATEMLDAFEARLDDLINRVHEGPIVTHDYGAGFQSKLAGARS